jgi:hypothetical protein
LRQMSVSGGADSLKGSIVMLVVAVMVANVVSTEKQSIEHFISTMKNNEKNVAAIYTSYEKDEWGRDDGVQNPVLHHWQEVGKIELRYNPSQYP